MKKYILIITVFIISIAGLYIIVNYNNKSSHNNGASTLEQQYNQKKEADLIVLKIAHRFTESHPQHIALTQKFAPMVEEQSNFKIRVEIYPNNQLGTEKDYVEGVREGTVEMCIGMSSLSEALPKLKIFEFPFIFDNYEQINKLLSSELSEQITKGMDSEGLHSLAWSLNGFRQISTFDKPITANSKIKPLKIATMFSKQNELTLKTMGFDAVPVDIDDMAIIAQQKVAEGTDYPLLSSNSNGGYKGQRYIYITNHAISADMYLVSSKFWDALPDKYKEIIERASKETSEFEIELLKDWEHEIIEELKGKGMEVSYPDLSLYRQSVMPLYNEWTKNDEELNKIFNKIMSEKAKLLYK